MRNAGLEGTQAGIRIARRNINNLRYADDTTLMAESEEELKSRLMRVKENEKAGLKLNIKKTKIMAYDPTLWYSCLKNPMDRGAWWTTIHGVAESQIQLGVCVHTCTKVGSKDIPGVKGKFGLGVQNEAWKRLTEFFHRKMAPNLKQLLLEKITLMVDKSLSTLLCQTRSI